MREDRAPDGRGRSHRPAPVPIRRRAAGPPAVPMVRELRRLLGVSAGAMVAVLAAAAGCAAWAAQANDSGALTITLICTVVVLAAFVSVLLLMVRRLMVVPITLLGEQVRQVTEGDFGRSVAGTGPEEIVALGEDVDLMRRRIIDEWTAATEARRLLDAHTEELRRSNAELEQFAYVASHDLQEPLRKVASFSHLLQRRYTGRLDERADKYLEFAADGATRMQAMVAGLLEFSRVGRRGIANTAVDLTETARQAVAGLAAAREETGAKIEILPLPTVTGDPVLLRQLLQNLLSNAIRFRGEDTPRIRLGARRSGPDGAEWELYCADNGIGVGPEDAERIFVIFQRLHTAEEYGGTGIGLSLCRKIVEHHGGRIWLDTAAGAAAGGRGTVIRWTLPRRSPG